MTGRGLDFGAREDIPSEARLDLQLGGGHELSGVVLRNGEPLAAAGLGLARASGAASQQTETDHQGGFRFSGLEDGAYRLRVRTPNGAWHQETVEVTGDQTIQVDLRTVSLSGRVGRRWWSCGRGPVPFHRPALRILTPWPPLHFVERGNVAEPILPNPADFDLWALPLHGVA
ncbi:MAG: carboxypeptidase-like regulatory domain-containing protein [Thermoanaerobaculia bacterium]